MTAAKDGYVGEFKTGYLQKAIILPVCAVIAGTDTGKGTSAASLSTGFAVGRIVTVTQNTDGLGYSLRPSTYGTPATYTHIIAQSDDSLRNVPEDAIDTEKYTTHNSDLLLNTMVSGSQPLADRKSVV